MPVGPKTLDDFNWGSVLEALEPTASRCRGRCFNGAATDQSRKSKYPISPSLEVSCFNGAATDQSRKFRNRSSRRRRVAGFNGAATDQSRKFLG